MNSVERIHRAIPLEPSHTFGVSLSGLHASSFSSVHNSDPKREIKVGIEFTVRERRNARHRFHISGKWQVSLPHSNGLIIQEVNRYEFPDGSTTPTHVRYWEAWIVQNAIVQFIDPFNNVNNTYLNWVTIPMPGHVYDDSFAGSTDGTWLVLFKTTVYWVDVAQQNAVLQNMPLGGVPSASIFLPATLNDPFTTVAPQLVLNRLETSFH